MKLAIIGSGISGLAVAHALRGEHELTLFEANDYVGGHTRTVECESAGRRFPVDTGFIVFNGRTYPRFFALLTALGVAHQPTEMSFSVSCRRTGLEYNADTVNTLFAQRRNLVNPWFYGLLYDILRFFREAPHALDVAPPPDSLGEYLAGRGYGRHFLERYLLPMAAAIWSCPVERIEDYPLANFIRFFQHHGLLSAIDRPDWRVILGGSRTYVQALTAPFAAQIRLRSPVRQVRRHPHGVDVVTDAGGAERYDRVVLATHSDQALRLLAPPTPDEARILGTIPYQVNRVTLHTDPAMLPRRKLAWASWNYRIPEDPQAPPVVTYNMNRLQGIRAPETFCVTLGEAPIDPARVVRRFHFEHPLFTPEAAAAQRQAEQISGRSRTHFCGAYWGNGFHEDGMASAARVVAEIRAAIARGEDALAERRRSA